MSLAFCSRNTRSNELCVGCLSVVYMPFGLDIFGKLK